MPKQERPETTLHIMCTIGGKIASGIKGVDILDDDYFITYTQTEDNLEVDSWLLGRVTMEMFAQGTQTPLPKAETTIDNSDFIAGIPNGRYVIAVDTHGVLRWNKNTVDFSNVPDPLALAILVTDRTPKDYLAYLRTLNISYLFAGQEDIDFDVALPAIYAKLGVNKLALEGGAILNGSALAANAIDHISLLICPIAVSDSRAPSVFERQVMGSITTHRFSLESTQILDKGVVWLRYNRVTQEVSPQA